MTEIPRRRAQINGLWVQFESRNPKLTTVRWHPRFKQRYRTNAQAQAAKRVWEERGKILWPEDFKVRERPIAEARRAPVRRETQVQQEMRL